MPRIDVWDVPADQPPEKQEPLWVGFTRGNLEDRYDVGKQLGQGGFGTVQVVVERGSGKEYACKSITKRLSLPNVSASKQSQHIDNIHREALILRRLRGTLNVVHLEDVFEDEQAVHLIMEWCKGGELLQRINTRHYSERTAASYMRAVLRTLAQCHHLRILHRDVKPGNFMLLTDADKAPVKAIDFGLAVFFDPKKLPRTDLGLEGTPHFMAPEQLSGKTEPASDIWSAGVMAYQLLSGQMPFDDAKNLRAPSLSLVWRAILTEQPRFSGRAWEGVSEQAKDFVRSLLTKDPAQRPTAKQALAHPWMQGKSDQRTQGAPLARTVVQRLQKFGVESALKRTVLDMIANDLINRHMEQLNNLNQLPPTDATTATAGGGAPPPPPQPQQQKPIERRLSRNSSAGRAASEAGEATPEGAAAAAVAGTPLPPPPTAVAADSGGAAVSSRLRQLAAQDLLMRSAASLVGQPKHATVHAGGDALAALRRGQMLGLAAAAPPPRLLVPPAAASTAAGAAASGGAGVSSPAGTLAAALVALQQQQQYHLQHRHNPNRRSSHDLGKRPLGRAATSVTPAAGGGTGGGGGGDAAAQPQSVPPLQAWQAEQQEQQRQQQEQQGQESGRGPEAPWRGAAESPASPPQVATAPPPPPSVRIPATAPPVRAAPRRPLSGMVLPHSHSSSRAPPPRPGSPGGSSSGRGGASPPASASRTALGGAGSASYKGPVKDLAAATAWDMSFMKNRLALEGSGHALQHYAWLLNVGERSLHGVLERSYHRAHSPTADVAPGASAASAQAGGQQQQQHQAAAVAVGSPAAAALSRRGHAASHLGAAGGGPGAAAAVAGGSPTGAGGGAGAFDALSSGSGVGGGVGGGSPDYLRMLSLVARQRAEHRKVQRLSLDTSGHRQSHYEELVAAEAEAAGGGGDPRVGGGSLHHGLMAPPKEEDEDEDEAAGGSSGGGTATASADTTGAFSLPPPSGATSAFATCTSLPPPTPHAGDAQPGTPATAASPSPPRLVPTAMQSLPQTPLQQALHRQSRGSGVPASPLPSAAGLSAAVSLKPSIPGLEEADALSRGGGIAATAATGTAAEATATPAAASASGPRGTSEGLMSNMSSPAPDGGAVSIGGEGSAAATGWGEGEDDEEGGDRGLDSGVPTRLSAAGSAAGGGEGGKRSSLLRKVRKALMNPVKNLLGSSSKHLQAASPGGAKARRQSGAGTGATTPIPPGAATPVPGPLAKLSAALTGHPGSGTPGGLDRTSVPAEERGRGRGAYAAFLQFGGGGGTGTATPQDLSGHGGTERSVRGGRERSAHGGSVSATNIAANGNGDRSAHSDKSGHHGRDRPTSSATQLLGPAGYAIHTVKAHKPAAAQPAAAAAPVQDGAEPGRVEAAPAETELMADGLRAEDGNVVAWDGPPRALAKGQGQASPRGELAGGPGLDALPQQPQSPEVATGAGTAAEGGAEEGPGGDKGGITQEDLAPALSLLLGDASKVAELQEVMRRLQYDKEQELTYEQLSEGLQWLGYRLEPSEVQDLLRQVTVGANEGLTASQFIASQVDWRTFQANHRAEWLDCLRKAFEELGGRTGGAGAGAAPEAAASESAGGGGGEGLVLSLEQLMAALHDKLPEEEVNLAVQESLMDAAVEADVVDFDAFVRLMRCNSNDSLASGASSEMSYDLYDPRLKDSSLHGPLGDGLHYTPALETVPDDPE